MPTDRVPGETWREAVEKAERQYETTPEMRAFTSHPLAEAVAGYHLLAESGAYARCSCGVAFFWADRAAQFERHLRERVTSALSYALTTGQPADVEGRLRQEIAEELLAKAEQWSATCSDQYIRGVRAAVVFVDSATFFRGSGGGGGGAE